MRVIWLEPAKVDTIHIVGFWDTRMDDEDQATSVK